MSSVEERLRAIEDRFAILDLEAAYAVAWDFGQAGEWAEVFTPDGCFEMLATGTTAAVRVSGHAELSAFCETICQNWTGLHFMHPPKLEIEGNSASSTIFFEFRHMMRQDNGHVRQGNTAGHYVTRYVRTADGWRIQSRVEQAMFETIGNSYAM